MNARQIYEAMILGGHLSPDPESVRAEAEREAEFEGNSLWVRAILYRQNQIIDEYDYLLDDTEDELYTGMDEETMARWRFAHADDGVDLDRHGEIVE